MLYPPEGAAGRGAGRGAGRRYPELDCLLGLNSPNISKVIGTATDSITRHDAKITWKNRRKQYYISTLIFKVLFDWTFPNKLEIWLMCFNEEIESFKISGNSVLELEEAELIRCRFVPIISCDNMYFFMDIDLGYQLRSLESFFKKFFKAFFISIS